MRCRSCGYDNRADSVYCGQCRAALARPCPACGEPAPVGAEACPACRAPLAATAPLSAQWPVTPGEPAGARDPADLAGPGAVGGGTGWPHGGGTRFTGVARDVQQRQYGQNGDLTLLEFRVERHDSSGNRLAPVPVEMRGHTHTFRGTVSNGDEIQITHGDWHGGTLSVDELDNLTTGATVRGRARLSREERVRLQAVLLVIVAVFGVVSWHSTMALILISIFGIIVIFIMVRTLRRPFGRGESG